jgi:hypothetical protein
MAGVDFLSCKAKNNLGFATVQSVCNGDEPVQGEDVPDVTADGVAKCFENSGCANLDEINKEVESEAVTAGDDSILKTHLIVITAVVDADAANGIVRLFLDAIGDGAIPDDKVHQICEIVVLAVSKHLNIPISELEDCEVEKVQSQKRQSSTESYVATFQSGPPPASSGSFTAPVLAIFLMAVALLF